MYKKVYSVLVIIFTIAYLIFNLTIYKIDLWKGIANNKVIQGLYKINLVKLFDFNKNSKIIYNETAHSSELTVNNSYSNSNSEISNEIDKGMFNKNESNDKQIISNLEKEKIMNLAKNLAPYDEAKIELYLNRGAALDVESAINLLRERLSDKEFEDIKSISLNYSKN